MNCRHHDIRYHNECRIPETEFVRDREKANFCDHFQLASTQGTQPQQNSLDEAKKRLDRLFGGG
jgi:hypothetical protein